MSSPIPGEDEVSEGSEVDAKLCFEADGVAVGLRNDGNVEELIADLRGGGAVCENVNDVRRVFFPARCLCNIKRGMASIRLVPMNYGR